MILLFVLSMAGAGIGGLLESNLPTFRYGSALELDTAPNKMAPGILVSDRSVAVPTGIWGAVEVTWGLNDTGVMRALQRAGEIGLSVMRDDLGSWEKLAVDTVGFLHRLSVYDSIGVPVIGILCYGHGSRLVTSRTPNASASPASYSGYPPRNLYEEVNSSTNHWAQYARAVMQETPQVRYWEVWNEPNACSTYFGNPDPVWYKGGTAGLLGDSFVDTPRERCSLYVRMCYIATQVARSLSPRRRVVAGATARIMENVPEEGVSPGVEWIQDMFDIAQRSYGAPESCFDMVSVHPYQHVGAPPTRPCPLFCFDRFKAELDTVRSVMSRAASSFFELWATEIGWNLYYWDANASPPGYRPVPGATPERNANNLCKFYVSSIASQASKSGGYDRVFWYELSSHRDIPVRNEGFGLLDSTPEQNRMPTSYALEQLIRGLTGKCVVRRLPDSGSAGDSLAQVYEFENPDGGRLWVGWVNDSVVRQDVAVPVRSDVVVGESLAYRSGNPPEFSVRSGPDGWLRLELTERPVFVREVGPRSRPDLVVDSVRVEPEEPRVGERMVIHAWVRNKASKETRATPRGMATKVLFMWEGDTLGYEETTRQIGVGKAVEVQFPVVEVGPELAGPALVKVVANPEQRYVELDMDNNDGYLKTEVR